jgi:hypothetical protein
VASHDLIEACVAELGRRLPPDVVDELADGLTETYERHLSCGADASAAAQAAIAEFGDPAIIAAAFARQAPARRTALALLVTGPAVGACWGVTLLVGHAWTWPIPTSARLTFGAALIAVVLALVAAVDARRSHPGLPFALVGGVGLVVLDTAMLAAVSLAAPFSWPMVVAVPASVTRIILTTRAMSHVLRSAR